MGICSLIHRLHTLRLPAMTAVILGELNTEPKMANIAESSHFLVFDIEGESGQSWTVEDETLSDLAFEEIAPIDSDGGVRSKALRVGGDISIAVFLCVRSFGCLVGLLFRFGIAYLAYTHEDGAS